MASIGEVQDLMRDIEKWERPAELKSNAGTPAATTLEGVVRASILRQGGAECG